MSSPRLLAGLSAIVIQPTLSEAVQLQPLPAVTATLPVPADAVKLRLVGEIV